MDMAGWPIIPGAPGYGQGRDHKGPRFTSLIHGEHLHNVTVGADAGGSIAAIPHPPPTPKHAPRVPLPGVGAISIWA